MRALISALFALGAVSGCFDRDLSGKACDGDHPCLDGFVCAAGTCLPPGEGCLSDADCTLPETCNADARCENPDPDCVDGDGDLRGPGCDAGDDCDDADAAAFASVSAFVDADRDGVGAGPAVTLCTDGTIPAGHAATDTDCDDDNAAGQQTVSGFVDADLDGVGTGPAELLCTDGTIPAGHAATDTDCDDGNADVSVALSAFVDGDQDGVGAGDPVTICTDGTIPVTHSTGNTDCNDADGTVRIALSAFVDGDRDGVGAGGAVTICTDGTIPVGHAATNTDCDDSDAAGFAIVAGFVDADRDGIGAGAQTTFCADGNLPVGAAAVGGDNCATTPNADQLDDDADTVGDACDVCPAVSDAGQQDTLDVAGPDGVGDACDPATTADTLVFFDPLTSLAGWTQVSGAWILQGTDIRQNTANGTAFLRHAGGAVTDAVVEARLAYSFNNDSVAAVAGRLDGGNNGYACALDRGANTLTLRRVQAGALNQIIATTGQVAPGNGVDFVLRLTMDGSALTCAFTGGASVSAVDATHAGPGQVGLVVDGARPVYRHVIAWALGN